MRVTVAVDVDVRVAGKVGVIERVANDVVGWGVSVAIVGGVKVTVADARSVGVVVDVPVDNAVGP